jgi:hypothetical protein
MSSTDPQRTPGYRGALPLREDRLARPWLIAVAAIFVLVFVLAVLGVPSRFIPDPTPGPTLVPTPSASASASAAASGSGSASESAGPSGSADASPSEEPSDSADASAAP